MCVVMDNKVENPKLIHKLRMTFDYSKVLKKLSKTQFLLMKNFYDNLFNLRHGYYIIANLKYGY